MKTQKYINKFTFRENGKHMITGLRHNLFTRDNKLLKKESGLQAFAGNPAFFPGDSTELSVSTIF